MAGTAELIDRLQFLAGLEANCLAGRNVDLGAGAWIAANTGFARTYVEDAKTAQFDAVALGESSLHTLEDGFHGALCLGLSDPVRFTTSLMISSLIKRSAPTLQIENQGLTH